MTRTANLRRQHDGALAIAGEISAIIERMGDEPSRDDAYAATMLLAKLTGVLRIHFAQEDKLLYPSLMASGRGGVAAVARAFVEEMGQIGPAFAAFSEKWRSHGAILAEPALFRTECLALFAALADRIRRENEELYPLADNLDENPMGNRAA
jgi:hypothetical protein